MTKSDVMKNNLIAATLLGWLGMLNFHFTADAEPTVTTLAATSVTSNSATLNGTANPNGASTVAYFQYGLTTNYGNAGGFATLLATNGTLTMTGLVVSSITGSAGASWPKSSSPGGGYNSIASSADGTRLAAVGGFIYTSTNSGVNWTQSTNAPFGGWVSIACSADGARLAAVVSGGGIWTSTDSGVNWTNTSAPATNWSSVASSTDGSRLAAGDTNGGRSTWTHSGANWTG